MQLLLNAMLGGVILGSAYGIAGVTFGLMYRVLKVFHFAFAAIGTTGALIAASMISKNGAGWGSVAMGFVAGMAVAAMATAVVVTVVYRPLMRRGATSGTTFVASLAVGLILEAVVAVVAGPASQTFAMTAFTRQTSILGLRVSALHVAAIVLLIVSAFAISGFLRRTNIGHETEALISNPEQAELVGINSRVLSISLCAALGAISVIAFTLQGLNSSVSLAGGVPLTLFGVLAMLCGGVTSVGRTALAGIAIGLISGISASLLPGQWASTIVFVLAAAVIIARPEGIGRKAGAA